MLKDEKSYLEDAEEEPPTGLARNALQIVFDASVATFVEELDLVNASKTFLCFHVLGFRHPTSIALVMGKSP